MKTSITISFRNAPRAAALLLAAAAMLGWAACSGKAAKPSAPPPVPVSVATAVEKDVPVQVTTIGTVEAYSTVAIKSQVAGELNGVHFVEGQDVKKGDRLFTIDRRPFEAELRRAEAQLARDQAQLTNARTEADRYVALQRQGVIAREAAEARVTNAEALAAAVKADEAAVEVARVQLQYCTIAAPISGRTGNLVVHKGNLVKANDVPALVTINQITPIYTSFSVPEQQLDEIKQHMARGKLEVQAAPPDQPKPARGALSFVDNAVDPATGTIKLKANFENVDRRLWPGQFVNVVLTLATEPRRIVVPSQAVQAGQNGLYVFVVKPDGTAENRQVVVERTFQSDSIISSGVKAGETVVTDGQLRLAPGARVEIKSAAATPTQGSQAGQSSDAQPAGRSTKAPSAGAPARSPNEAGQ